MLLLHGLAGSARELQLTAATLKGHRVLLMDQRGHGRSTRRPSDLSREVFVDDVIAVIEDLAPGQRCVLVGQSTKSRSLGAARVAVPWSCHLCSSTVGSAAEARNEEGRLSHEELTREYDL